jgi:hypothetical protein
MNLTRLLRAWLRPPVETTVKLDSKLVHSVDLDPGRRSTISHHQQKLRAASLTMKK